MGEFQKRLDAFERERIKNELLVKGIRNTASQMEVDLQNRIKKVTEEWRQYWVGEKE